MNTIDNQHGCWALSRNPVGIQSRAPSPPGPQNPAASLTATTLRHKVGKRANETSSQFNVSAVISNSMESFIC
jgi:hypothetical protein